MSFSVAQFQSLVDKINAGMDDIAASMRQIPETVHEALDALDTVDRGQVPDVLAEGTVWLAERMLDLAQQVWERIREVLEGIAAPVYFWIYQGDLETLQGIADDVAAHLGDARMAGSADWSGRGAEAYRRQVPAQRDAVTEVSALAGRMKDSLTRLAVAGLAFYVALGVIVVKLVAALVAAVAALGSVVLSWAGAALVVEEAGVITGLIAAAVSALGVVVTDQAAEMTEVGDAASTDRFPDGHWPRGHLGEPRDDARVGDDWSLD